MAYCKICGIFNCRKHVFLVAPTDTITEFSGSSPPEIFVGRYNYPNVNIGILSPKFYGENQILSSPEEWHKNQLSTDQIVELRKELIYGRTKNHIKKLNDKFLRTMQEVAMTERSISCEFKLKKPIFQNMEKEKSSPLISKAAQIKRVRLEENPRIKPKVEYITSDTDAKSRTSILELEKHGLNSSEIIKILSAGLLGIKNRRKLVPTKWSITAVDNTLSKEKLKEIKLYNEIDEITVFYSEYLGNHYEFLLLPDKFSFEVIEISAHGIWHDYESFFARKNYAEEVTGAYYANRLAVAEHLKKIKRQSSIIVFREILPEYNIPLGVGILRETSREAFRKKPEKYDSIKQALETIQKRLKIPIENFSTNSMIIKNYKKQKRISEWFS